MGGRGGRVMRGLSAKEKEESCNKARDPGFSTADPLLPSTDPGLLAKRWGVCKCSSGPSVSTKGEGNSLPPHCR